MGEPTSGKSRLAPEILLVEDHEATAEMVLMVLEDAGYNVKWVSTAKAALACFPPFALSNGHEHCPDLILLDLTLPDMDPVKMVHQMIMTHGSSPPIVVVSAKTVEAVQAAAIKIGAVAVVHKPFPLDTLLDNISYALNNGS